VDQLQQGHAADTKYCNLRSALLHGQTKQVAIVGGDAIEISDPMPTAPMWTGARLAAVGIAEGLGASMVLLYGPSARRHNCANTPVCRVSEKA
jgi:hypothetical protein